MVQARRAQVVNGQLTPVNAMGRALATIPVGSPAWFAWLDDARTQHLAVVPFCPFVAGYIRRHPAYKALVHPDYRDLVEGEPGEGQNG